MTRDYRGLQRIIDIETVVFIVFKGFFFYLERQQTLFLDLFLISRKDEKTSTF